MTDHSTHGMPPACTHVAHVPHKLYGLALTLKLQVTVLCRLHRAKAATALQARLAEHRAEEARKDAQARRKEQLRPVIKNNLLLKIGHNKPSLFMLLRALNISVEGGHLATDKQIEKAYKRATVQFHPDKHVTSDLARQIEAEETFKMLSEAAARPRRK